MFPTLEEESQKKAPSVAEVKRLNFIIADFSQNISIVLQKKYEKKKGKSIFRPYEVNSSITEAICVIQ